MGSQCRTPTLRRKKNIERIKEEQLKEIEKSIQYVVEQAQLNGISLQELLDIVKILYGDETYEK